MRKPPSILSIPLSSKKTFLCVCVCANTRSLSIPLSSKKTVEYKKGEQVYIHFLSHLVQRKHFWSNTENTWTCCCFLSHLVQRKQMLIKLLSLLKQTFYPTWFKENHISSKAYLGSYEKLSIPLGSKKTISQDVVETESGSLSIPLGSKKTLCIHRFQSFKNCLSIPLGSKKTAQNLASLSSSLVFLSHLVQRKPFQNER